MSIRLFAELRLVQGGQIFSAEFNVPVHFHVVKSRQKMKLCGCLANTNSPSEHIFGIVGNKVYIHDFNKICRNSD